MKTHKKTTPLITIVICLIIFSKPSFSQNPFVSSSATVEILIERVQAQGTGLSQNDDLYFIASDKLNKTFNSVKWEDKLLKMAFIRHTPLNDAANWYYFISVTTEKTSTPFFVYYDPANTFWGTYAMVEGSKLPIEFKSHVEKMNAEMEADAQKKKEYEEYISNRTKEIMQQISPNIVKKRDAIKNYLDSIANSRYNSIKLEINNASFLNDKKSLLSDLSSAYRDVKWSIKVEIDGISDLWYVDFEIEKDDMNALVNITNRWDKEAEESIQEEEKNISKTYRDKVLYKIEYQKALYLYRETESIIKEIVSYIVVVNPDWIKNVNMAAISKMDNKNEILEWSNAFLTYSSEKEDDIKQELFNKQDRALEPIKRDIPAYLVFIEQYYEYLQYYSPATQLKAIDYELNSLEDSVKTLSKQLENIVKRTFCVSISTNSFTSECFSKSNKYIFEAAKIIILDFNNSFGKNTAKLDSAKSKYSNISYSGQAKDNFTANIVIGNEIVNYNKEMIIELKSFIPQIEKMQELLRHNNIKEINKEFKKLTTPHQIYNQLSKY